jgi:HEAT repeats
MPRNVLSFLMLFSLILLLPGLTKAEEAGAGEGIAWSKNLKSALEQAAETEKIVMICINAKFVEGRQEEERAAKGLREKVYLDPRVVKRSRDFVCVMLTPEGSSTDYAELSSLGIGGKIISPQHIFVSADGERVVYRKEYWSYGKGDKAVEALLSMMDKAEGRAGEPGDSDEPADEADGPPAGAEARAAWIADMLEVVVTDVEERGGALKALIKADEDGDCTDPLIELLPKHKKDVGLSEALIRALGINGLEKAAEPITAFLTHKEPTLRANAAVSLEYIGSREKKVVSALLKSAGKQKDEAIGNHMCRALGRCGVEEDRARTLLLKMAAAGRSEFATYGALIGLAYFEDDPKAARGVEQLVKLIGIPGGGRRGGGGNIVKRGLASWTLARIGDEKSAKFMREVMLTQLENVRAFWVPRMVEFWEAVALKCGGDDSAMNGIEAGVGEFVNVANRFNMSPFEGEGKTLMDDARKLRDNSEFTPLADNLLPEGDD